MRADFGNSKFGDFVAVFVKVSFTNRAIFVLFHAKFCGCCRHFGNQLTVGMVVCGGNGQVRNLFSGYRVARFSAQIANSMRLYSGIFARCRNFCNQITQFVTVRIDRNIKIGNFRIACVVILVADAAMLVSLSARGLTSCVLFFYPKTKTMPVVWADGSFQRFFGCFVFVCVKELSARCAFVVCFHTRRRASCGLFFNKRAKCMIVGCGDSQRCFGCFFFAFVKVFSAPFACIVCIHTRRRASCGFYCNQFEIMFSVGIAEIAACRAFFSTTANKLVACILRAFVKSRCNAGASRVGAFCVAVMLEIYLLDFFNPCMLVSARYCRNPNRNIASLSVRRRCGDVHRAAVHCVFCDYLIVAIRFVKSVTCLNFHSYGRILCLILIRSGRAADPHTRIGIFCGDLARHLFVDSGSYVSRIADIRHSSGNEKIHFYCRCNGVLSCAVPKFYILAFAEFRTRHFHMAFKHVCVFGQFVVFFRLKKDADTIRDLLLDKLVFNPAPRERRFVFFPHRCCLSVFCYEYERCRIVCARRNFERFCRFVLEFKRGGKAFAYIYPVERYAQCVNLRFSCRINHTRRACHCNAEHQRKAHNQPQRKHKYLGF